MAYTASSTANTATPAKDFMELVMHPALSAAGFTYIEQVLGPNTVSGETWVSRIYKSDAAANGVGDWHLAVIRYSNVGLYSGNPAIYLGVSETYDIANHKMTKYATRDETPSGNTLPTDRTHYNTAGLEPHSTAVWSSGQYGLWLSASAHAYVLSVNNKRIVISTRFGTTESVVYAGLYDSILYGVANDFPLVNAVTYGGNYYVCTAFTREPGTGLTQSYGSSNSTFTSNQGVINWGTTVTTYAMDGYFLKPTISSLKIPASQGKSGFRGYALGLYGSDGGFSWGDIAQVDWEGSPMTATCVYSTNGQQRFVDQAA